MHYIWSIRPPSLVNEMYYRHLLYEYFLSERTQKYVFLGMTMRWFEMHIILSCVKIIVKLYICYFYHLEISIYLSIYLHIVYIPLWPHG